MTPDQLKTKLIGPVLQKMEAVKAGMFSSSAVNLILATGIHESDGLKRITQYGNGPALSYFQMEPATLKDLYDNWLYTRPDMLDLLESFKIPGLNREENLMMNIPYAIAATRLQYWRVPDPIPISLEGMAHYWKKYWNTEKGRGTPEEFINNVKEFI